MRADTSQISRGKQLLGLLRRCVARIVPHGAVAWLQNLLVLNVSYGHLRSALTRTSVDRGGEPIPWYTYPALEYLDQLDFSKQSVFEFGSGNSSLYWARRSHRVISVESSPSWSSLLRAKAPGNLEVLHLPGPDEYVAALDRFPGDFDLILVDGDARRECCKRARARLARGGVILLDNSDWYPDAAGELLESGLIQVDFSGFGPINGYTWTTSLFLEPAFRPVYRQAVAPGPSLGAIPP